MRGYVALTPKELQDFINSGTFDTPSAFVASIDLEENLDVDQEELEFEMSWLAAQESRGKQDLPEARGFVLAVDLVNDQVGEKKENQVSLLSPISWSQVESLLLSESDEPELSWFAAQEIPTYLPQWLA